MPEIIDCTELAGRLTGKAAAELGLVEGIPVFGGGALSPVTCQMLSDITGRRIETVNNTQEVGAMGTALVVAAGIKGMDVLELSRQLVKANRVYVPDPANQEVYERNYRVFKGLYKANAKGFQALNA